MTNTPWRVMVMPWFYFKLAQFTRINNLHFVKRRGNSLNIYLPLHKSYIVNCYIEPTYIKTKAMLWLSLVYLSTGLFAWLFDGSFWLQVTLKTDKKWHKKCIFAILIISTHIPFISVKRCDIFLVCYFSTSLPPRCCY